MRVLVLGGTQFIGPHVVRQLVAGGHDVAVYHRGETEAELPANVRHIHCGSAAGETDSGGWLERLPQHEREIQDFAPEVVLHMIAYTERDLRPALDLAAQGGRRLVVISSQDVYRAFGRLLGTESGPPDPLPLTEDSALRERLYPYRSDPPLPDDDPQHWRDEYDKIPVERLALTNGAVAGTVLRLPAVYGPGDKQHRLWPYLKRMDDGRTAIAIDERVAQWHWARGYVEDIAAGIALAVTHETAAGKVYNVAESDALTETEWIRAIGEAAGWHGEIVATPPDRLPESLRVGVEEVAEQDLVVDTSRIRRELGYAERLPRSEALRRTVAWERAHPPKERGPSADDYSAEDAALDSVRRASRT